MMNTPNCRVLPGKHRIRAAVAGALLAHLLAGALGATGRAQVFGGAILHSFADGFNDGAAPYSGLVQGSDGVLYGTSWGAGAEAAGTVFRINRDGSGYEVLRSFTHAPDGATPFAGLVQGRDGWLYGTTYYGGISNVGTVFRINTNGGGYSVLHSFTKSPDGALPYAGLMQGNDGALYGTTYAGGIHDFGTVFRINPDGSDLTLLHSFTNMPDGALPFAGLVQGSDGVLYGTTYAGGQFVVGTVFRIHTNGSGYSVLHSFGYLPDGASPQSVVVPGNDGALYGTTLIGGSNGFGTVFKINTNGTGYLTLHDFADSPDGANSYAGLVQASDGALYGTTAWGGSTNGGTLFRLNPDGSGYEVLHHFAWGAGDDGSHPFAVLTGSNGVFYGTTEGGGAIGLGSIFRIALLPELRIARTAQGVDVTVTGFPGQPCQIQAATNLTGWSAVANLVLTNGTGQFTDSGAANLPRRFYRGAVQ